MSHNVPTSSREERKRELIYKWNGGKNGQMAVLSMFHKISPSGDALRPGISVIDVILDDAFGPEPVVPTAESNGSDATDESPIGWSKV